MKTVKCWALKYKKLSNRTFPTWEMADLMRSTLPHPHLYRIIRVQIKEIKPKRKVK